MRKTGAALCAGLVKVMEALVTVAGVVVMFFVYLWQASRWDPTKWQLDIERLVEEAQRAGLCTYVYVEHLRTEREPLRAEACEHAPSTGRVGVAFVPESKVLQGSLGAPQLIGGERMRTVLSAVPRPIYDAVLARPADERLEALLVIEDKRLRFNCMCVQDVPPDGERFYAILWEALQRRRDAEWPSLDRLPEPRAPGAHPLTEAPHKRNDPVAEHGRGAGANHMTARGIPRDEPPKKYRPSEPRDYRPGEWEAVDRLLDEATKAGLFFMLPLDNLLDVMELWTERAPLRADLTEHATATTFGLCFVPVRKQHPVVPPKGHLVVRLTPEGGGEELPTVLVSVETGTILQAKTMRAVISTSPETMQKFASLGRVLLVFILMCEKGIPLPRSIGKLARDNEATR